MATMYHNLISKIIPLVKRFLSFLNENNKGHKLWFSVVAVVLTIGILGYLLVSQWPTIKNYQWNLNYKYLGFAFIVYSIILFFNVLIWTGIMKDLGSRDKVFTHFQAITISALGKRLPGTIWYVLWRAEIYKDSISGKLIAVASGVEMAVQIIAAIFVCSIFSIPIIIRYNYSIFIIVFLLAINLALLHPKIIRWIFKKLKVEGNDINYWHLVQWIAGYLIEWVFVGILLYCYANVFIPISENQVTYFIGSVAITGVLSRLLLFSPSTLGFGEISLSLLLSGVMPSSLAVVVAVSNRIFNIGFEILWAMISLFISRLNYKKSVE